MTDRNDNIERIANRARTATVKVADEAYEGVEAAGDESRDAAKRVFEKIREAREKAEKAVKPVRPVKPVRDDGDP